jgi:neurotransmitter:Na+ symporter, NSS family
VFRVLPTAFAEMPGGRLVGTLFFLLLVFAALTPSLAGIEPMVAWLEQRRRCSRPKASFLTAGALWIAGLGSVLSFNLWSQWHPLAAIPRFRDMTFFALMDFIAANILTLAGAFLTSILVGWRVSRTIIDEQLIETAPTGRRIIVWLLRYLCPVAIVALLLAGLLES